MHNKPHLSGYKNLTDVYNKEMQKVEPLLHGKFYHIYNRGINRGDIFFESDNYKYFIKLYESHIEPIADTYAWCLMKNHFHFLVRIKDEHELSISKAPHQCFSNLFNAYTKAINKKIIGIVAFSNVRLKENCCKKLIIYIHNNPVNHEICKQAMDYPWSSYLTCVSNKITKAEKKRSN